MLKLAVLAVAAATTTSTPALDPTAPWWEKVTVTIAGDGNPKACEYTTSRDGGSASPCDVAETDTASIQQTAAPDTPGQLTKITFERRFVPGQSQPQQADIQAGESLLGGQVMALAIDDAGAVKGCKVVARAGSVTPDYGCDEAAGEKFEASAGDVPAPAQGFMTILVYGHQENVA